MSDHDECQGWGEFTFHTESQDVETRLIARVATVARLNIASPL